MQLLTINEAAAKAGKSIQTIRRMIKQKKIIVKRQKTPQGFNYLIIGESLMKFLGAPESIAEVESLPAAYLTDQKATRTHRAVNQTLFTVTIQKLVEQNERDKENFFNLIKTFQDRVISLENQIKILEAPKKKWWKPW